MGLYFPDTVRPKGGQCPLRQDVPFRGPYCPIYNACRGDACPVIDVGPHGRLIDAEALDADLTQLDMRTGEDDAIGFSIYEIDNAPTIIPAEKGAE